MGVLNHQVYWASGLLEFWGTILGKAPDGQDTFWFMREITCYNARGLVTPDRPGMKSPTSGWKPELTLTTKVDRQPPSWICVTIFLRVSWTKGKQNKARSDTASHLPPAWQPGRKPVWLMWPGQRRQRVSHTEFYNFQVTQEPGWAEREFSERFWDALWNPRERTEMSQGIGLWSWSSLSSPCLCFLTCVCSTAWQGSRLY